jgi:hypothetical protein
MKLSDFQGIKVNTDIPFSEIRQTFQAAGADVQDVWERAHKVRRNKYDTSGPREMVRLIKVITSKGERLYHVDYPTWLIFDLGFDLATEHGRVQLLAHALKNA